MEHQRPRGSGATQAYPAGPGGAPLVHLPRSLHGSFLGPSRPTFGDDTPVALQTPSTPVTLQALLGPLREAARRFCPTDFWPAPRIAIACAPTPTHRFDGTRRQRTPLAMTAHTKESPLVSAPGFETDHTAYAGPTFRRNARIFLAPRNGGPPTTQVSRYLPEPIPVWASDLTDLHSPTVLRSDNPSHLWCLLEAC